VLVRNYLPALLVSLALTLLMLPLQQALDLSNTALLYVLAVVVIGSRYGRGPAIASALLGSLLYAHVFVPPRFSLAITEVQYLLAAGVMLVVAVLVGHLTASLKVRAEQVQARETQARALYELARHLSASLTPAEVAQITSRFLGGVLQASASRIVPESDFAQPPAPLTPALLQSALAGRHPQLSAGSRPADALLLAPLIGSAGPHGVLACELPAAQAGSPATREFLETVASVVAVALERTHFAEMARETELRRSAEALRNSILAALSHDLRTPLTVMVGLADTLTLGKASPERQRSMLDALRSQALSINQQVTNLLDMARLRSGSIELHEAWQPVEEVIGATLRQVRAQWKDREISVDLPPDLPPLRFDAVLVERLLWNLLENAIKYSPADTPVELVVRRVGDWVDLMVCDWGPGLPPEGGEELFGLFRRGQAESSIPGVGLGLAIARGFAEAHGGQVLAENRLGGGACFRLRLPVGNPPTLGELENAT
jgi:two-component system sensor histidine kinase KdpD